MSTGIASALGAAVLFGASTPFAKLLVNAMPPVMLAGLLYLGSGIGLLGWFWWRRRSTAHHRVPEAALGRRDLPWLAGAILTGGVLGPVLLMSGLAQTAATNASLLLNLEGVLTALLAWFVFHENFARRVALGMTLIVAGGALLSLQSQTDYRLSSGALMIVGACLCWAIDNNLTRKVSAGDPVQISGLKGLIAGLTNTVMALVMGIPLPAMLNVSVAGTVGVLGYGMSLVLFVYALRHLGSVRTVAYFSTAPFVGVAVSLTLLGETAGPLIWPATGLMAVGLWLNLTERHEHQHEHESLGHTHRHVHDMHHQHEHNFPWNDAEPHSHFHSHAPLKHSHSHYPDIHHRHHH